MSKPAAPTLNAGHILYSDASGGTLTHAFTCHEGAGATLHDLMGGASYNGTLTGATAAWATDPNGDTVLNLANAGDYVPLASAITSADTWTVAFRIKKAVYGGSQVLFGHSGQKTTFQLNGNAGVNENNYFTAMFLRTSKEPYGGTNATTVAIFPSIADKTLSFTWHNWVMSFDGTTLRIYKDGSVVYSNSTIPSGATAAQYRLNLVDNIGYQTSLGNTGYTFQGQIHHLLFYDGAFSAAQVAAHAAQGVDGLLASGALSASVNAVASALTGTSAGLQAIALGGTPAYSYQWQSSPDNSTFTNIGGATSQTFAPTGLTPGSTQYYRVVVTDAASGSVTSASATVTTPARYLALAIPPSRYCYQRSGSGTTTCRISGAYQGTAPSGLQYQLDAGGWVSASSPTISGGAWSFDVSLTDGWQGTLAVRETDSTGTVASSTLVGVGDVFVVAGQSNAEGRLASQQTYSHATLKASAFRQSGFETTSTGDGSWVDGKDPTDNNQSQGSMWPLLATICMAGNNVPVAFVTTALGSTTLDGGYWLPPSGAGYQLMKAQVLAAGYDGAPGRTVRAVLWYQGEQDTNGTRATHLANLQALGDAMYADLPGGPSILPVVFGVTGSNADGIKLSIQDVMGTHHFFNGGSYVHDLDNNLHPVGTGNPDSVQKITVGRMYAALKEAFWGGAAGSGRGLRLSSATGSGTSVTVKFDKTLKTGLIFNAALWNVSDSGGAKAVSAVAYHPTDPTAVVLTLGSSLGASPTVSYALGAAAPAGKVGPKGVDFTPPGGVSGTIQMPAELFLSQPISAPPAAPASRGPIVLGPGFGATGSGSLIVGLGLSF